MDFLNLLKSHRRQLSFAFFYVVLTNLLALALPWSIKIMMDEIFFGGKKELLSGLFTVLAGIICLRLFTSYWGSILGMRIGEKIAIDLRQRFYTHILRLSVLRIEKIPIGSLVSRVISDIDAVKRFFFNGFLDFFYSLLIAIFVTAILFFMDWNMAIFVILFLPVFLLTYMMLCRKLEEEYENLRELQGDLSGQTAETLRGIRTVHIFHRINFEVFRFSKKQDHILKTAFQTYAVNAKLWAVSEFLSSMGLVFLLWFGAHRVLTGHMTAGTLVAFYTYMGFLFLPVMRIAAINNTYREARAAMSRILEVFSQLPEPVEAKNPISFKKIKGDVKFQRISFSYDGSRKALDDISLSVDAGQTVALVGPSGSGKTTLVSLLARFFDPDSGTILIDGHDLKELKVKDHREQIAMVLQNDFLFGETIKESILYGDLGAGDHSIRQAAEMANIHDFIKNLPQQYETKIGEGGIYLSGGEKQRLVIARAILKNPSVLILDEASSAVDSASEHFVTDAIQKLMKGRTIFIIAHRLSTIRHADQIIVLDKGKVLETGSHEDLLLRNSFYGDLCQRQFRNVENTKESGIHTRAI